MPSAPISASASSCWRVDAAALDHGQPLGVGGDVLELAAEPQFDIGMVVDLRPAAPPADRRDAPPNRARRRASVAASPSGRRMISPPAARAHQADGVGRDRARGQAAPASRDRSARGWHWARAAGRRRLPRAARPFPARRRESPLPRAPARPSIPRSRHQRRRWCATPPPADQATLSFSTHSGGRASPASRSAAKRYSVEQ